MTVQSELIDSVRSSGRLTLNEVESKQLMTQAGIPVVETRLATSRDEAVAIAVEMGLPVALKVVSPDIVHKSDAGGVCLGLTSVDQVAVAYESIVAKADPRAQLHGVSVQRMVAPAAEVIVGMYKDRQFGAVLVFGLGGVFAEVLRDVSFRVAPLTERDAREMIREIKGYRVLEGYRGQGPVDFAALEDMLIKLSRFVERTPEINEIDLNPVFAGRDGAVAVDARVILDPEVSPTLRPADMRPVSVCSLESAFDPKVAALWGDTHCYGKCWAVQVQRMAAFKGKLYAVEGESSVLELGLGKSVDIAKMATMVPSLADIPEKVDYVMACLPPADGPRVVRECVAKDVGTVAFITPGFAENDPEVGGRLQREMVETARRGGVNLIGPNCMGLGNPKSGFRFPDTGPGLVGVVSQSGGICISFMNLAVEHGIKVGKSMAFGNGAMLESIEFLEYMRDDEEIKIIFLQLEGTRDGRRLFHVLRQVASKKPVVVWKTGQTAAGKRAAASHSGALAESRVVWDGMIRQCGAIAVSSLEEAVDTLKVLQYLEVHGLRQAGSRVGVVGTSGGDMVATTDAFSRVGLEVPLLSEETLRKAARLVAVGARNNPFDLSNTCLIGGRPLETLTEGLAIMGNDSNIDWVAMDFTVTTLRSSVSDESLLPITAANLIKQFIEKVGKPLLVILPGTRTVVVSETRQKLMEYGIPVFSRDGAAKAVSNVVEYSRSRSER